jgi:phosphoribosyl 1,2-cyclic phosphate phosphodiesterase
VFLGTGTSTGVPIIGSYSGIAASPDPHNRRMRCSLLISAPAGELLVDCGPDFHQQAFRYRIDRVDEVLLTHEHADHISGLDELRLYNFRQRADIPIHATPRVHDDLRSRFAYAFQPVQQGGGVPKFDLRERVAYEPFEACGLVITPIPYLHGVVEVTGFLFGRDFAYMTDCSAIPAQTLEAVRGVDTLVLGALRPKPHSTHFTIEQAQAAAAEIGARRTYFVHMTQDVDHGPDGARLRAGCAFAYDGMTLEFGGEG